MKTDMAPIIQELRRQGYPQDHIERVVNGIRRRKPWALAYLQTEPHGTHHRMTTINPEVIEETTIEPINPNDVPHELALEALRRYSFMVLDSPNTRKTVVQTLFACGVSDVTGRTLEEWGKEFHCTKQAMQQGIAKIQQDLGLPRVRTMHSKK